MFSLTDIVQFLTVVICRVIVLLFWICFWSAVGLFRIYIACTYCHFSTAQFTKTAKLLCVIMYFSAKLLLLDPIALILS